MHVRCKFRNRRSIPRPRFPIKVQHFCHLVTFSVDFCILYAECPPYFYFRFVWPTDLESIPHASTPTSIILTNFEVDMTIHYRGIAFLSAHTSRDLVTLSFDHLTLNSCRKNRQIADILHSNRKLGSANRTAMFKFTPEVQTLPFLRMRSTNVAENGRKCDYPRKCDYMLNFWSQIR